MSATGAISAGFSARHGDNSGDSGSSNNPSVGSIIYDGAGQKAIKDLAPLVLTGRESFSSCCCWWSDGKA
jgi:hypothetical protein